MYKLHKQYRFSKHNYADKGAYFVTICTKNRIPHFGEIENLKIKLSSTGQIVTSVWSLLPSHFKNINLDVYQVMPDHFHGILLFSKELTKKDLLQNPNEFKSGIKNNPMELKNVTLGRIIRWFKAKVKYESKRINPQFEWQSRFYDRIIRSDVEFYFTREYIINNPINFGNNIIREYYEKNP